jgi:CopG family nickel-responsive transcriptional regulator
MSLARFGVSLDKDLLKALDDFVIENSLHNRSQAIRHLVEKIWLRKNGIATRWLQEQ